jgi:hypothetical protein
MESFHHSRYELSKPRLDRFEHTLGIFKERQLFLLEAPIENSIDFSAELFVSDGQYPDKTLAGVEQKNASYLGVMTDYKKLPKGIKAINEKLAPILKDYNYRCALSPESRVTNKGKVYLLDPCARFPQPPTAIQLEIIDNFGELVWEVATGQKPVIKHTHKYGAQLVIKSEFSQKEPQAIYFPESIRKYVKVKNLCIQDGVWYYIPCDHDMAEFASVIGMGDSVNAAIKQCVENAKLIEGDGIDIDLNALDRAKDEIKHLPEYGINIFNGD